jgi:hypothetical protein
MKHVRPALCARTRTRERHRQASVYVTVENLRNLNRLLCQYVVRTSKTMSTHTLRVPGVEGSQISRQSAHERFQVVSRTHRPVLPPPQKIFLVLIYVRGLVDLRSTVQPEELSP